MSETSILFKSNRQVAYAVAHSRYIDDAPAGLRPLQDNGFWPPATADWLARQANAGRIPQPDEPVPPDVELAATSRLVLTQAVADSAQPACPALDGPLGLSLREGDEIPFSGAIHVSVTDGEHESFPRRFLALDHAIIQAQAGPVDVVVRGIPDAPASVCRPGD